LGKERQKKRERRKKKKKRNKKRKGSTIGFPSYLEAAYGDSGKVWGRVDE